MNRLVLNTRVTDGRAALRPTVDGLDLLDGYRRCGGLDPDDLLPPLSRVLLPTRAPRTVIIGCCSCGVTGCGSLSLSVRRLGTAVLWEPVESPADETLSRSYRFDLLDYLDALDADAEDRADEGRGRRVARMVRLALGLHDARYDSLRGFHAVSLDWICAWPWHGQSVEASTTGPAGQQVHEFHAALGESDLEFAARICAELDEIRLPRS